MEYYSRKPTRLPNYDYSTQNYYFVTVCAYEKKCIFGKPAELNRNGEIVKSCIDQIQSVFSDILVDNYIVMPNHIHIILAVTKNNATSISTVIGQLKAAVTKEIRTDKPQMTVWQRSFHDHIIRNQKEYEKIWNYVEHNVAKWEQDCFYTD